MLPTTPDSELLTAYLHGKDAAFTTFLQRHAPLVYNVALRRTQDVAMAEEIAQDVFATAARKAPKLARHPGIAAWLHVTTRHVADRARAKTHRHQAKLARFRETSPPMATAPSADLAATIDPALARLPEGEREILVLRFFEDLDYPEIAARTGVSEAAARKRVSRGLRTLEKRLGTTLAGGAALAALPHTVPAAVLSTLTPAKIAAAAALAPGVTLTLLKAGLVASIATTVGLGSYTLTRDEAEAVAITPIITAPDPELIERAKTAETQRDRALADLASLRETVSSINDEVVVSYGKVEDLADDFASVVLEAANLRKRYAAGEDVPKSERMAFRRRAQDLTRIVGEIVRLEGDPDEGSRFFVSLHAKLLKTSPSRLAQLAPIYRAALEEAAENGLTMNKAPQRADAFEEWQALRAPIFAAAREVALARLSAAQRSLLESQLGPDSLWPRDTTVKGSPLIFDPSGDAALGNRAQHDANLGIN